jgi:hypothetical protein
MSMSSPRRLSTLESLPVEVLQKIFVTSLELNLPRASDYLADALSIPLIYTWLIRVAFTNLNDSSRQGLFTADFLPSPLNPFALTTAERTHLQNEILNCRWCTLSLVRKCQREYIEHVIRRKCLQGDLYIFNPEDLQKLTNLTRYFNRLKDMDRGYDNGRRGRGDLILTCKKKTSSSSASTSPSTPTAERHDKRHEERKIAIWFHFGALQIREPSPVFYETDVFRLPSCLVDSPARIPEKLLTPPFNDEKLEFLTLLAPEAYIDEDNTYERAKRVLRDLIKERDLRTFKYLLTLHIRTKIYNYPVEWPARPSVFMAATKCAITPNDPFIKLLVEKRWDQIPTNDHGRIRAQLMANLGRSGLGGATPLRGLGGLGGGGFGGGI